MKNPFVLPLLCIGCAFWFVHLLNYFEVETLLLMIAGGVVAYFLWNRFGFPRFNKETEQAIRNGEISRSEAAEHRSKTGHNWRMGDEEIEDWQRELDEQMREVSRKLHEEHLEYCKKNNIDKRFW